MMRLSYDLGPLPSLLRSLGARRGGLVEHVIRRAAREAEALLREKAPRRTGRMARSIGSVLLGPDRALVGVGADYAIFVELGTRPHEIRPRRARALRFEIGGRIIFATRVLHPGIRPRFFAREAAEELSNRLGQVISGAWEDVAG